MAKKRKQKRRDDYVAHPRYGSQPRVTGVDSSTSREHWKYCRGRVIPNTGVHADTKYQLDAIMPLFTYFDIECQCRDCSRPFIFFADEQKYWHETLSIPLEAHCIRCPDCRRWHHHLQASRQQYETLVNKSDRTADESFELLDSALTLIEAGIFQQKVLQKLRAELNSLSEADRVDNRFQRLASEIERFEQLLIR